MQNRVFSVLLAFLIARSVFCLYPYETPTREVKKLDGIWSFRICPQDDQEIGFREKWFLKSLSQVGDTIPMPVPASFNDITQNKTIRDYLGWSWYDTTFYIPQRWLEDKMRVILRFGSAHYISQVYFNGVSVVNHTGGHLPFEADVTDFIKSPDLNRVTVALNNTLSNDTVPQGSKTFKPKPYPPEFYSQGTNFDFFNYAGIHRSVVLYALPQNHVSDITVVTDVIGITGYIKFEVTSQCETQCDCSVTILDKEKNEVAHANGFHGTIVLKNATLWWPFTMHSKPGYQYEFSVSLSSNGSVVDIYVLKIGIRSVAVTNSSFFVNGKPFYFMGFGKHEDSNIRGKGLDLPLIVKDFNLIKWTGANSFRTSHYPYSEELMDLADDLGIAVVDECPAVGLQDFTEVLLNKHKQALSELIKRDKNRPSVFAWSVANEPRSTKSPAKSYFRQVVALAKQLDPTRPITAAINADPKADKAGKYLDYVMMNRYYGWYDEAGSTDVIVPLLVDAITKAHQIYNKPIMISEYGAGSIAGLHMDPPFTFTEDYQAELIMQHHKAFDVLRKKGFFVGEHIWNFADFLTQQGVNRVVGNKKGIFTRERQPKAAARIIRWRYHKLVNKTLEDRYCPYL